MVLWCVSKGECCFTPVIMLVLYGRSSNLVLANWNGDFITADTLLLVCSATELVSSLITGESPYRDRALL